ncbi:hypothetical protein BU25DRAFT_420732 [Macroventuria anomochaeta]|uniref:Uncharacterized protein n=1 Tax=Macroventuria anomochaeta TaxID=301207 RepID=A0ACB6S491_9PLEO|nr:uncharacterized protein BU25DRAFT_420732 [Macroventuria anomochaeta]KAF2628787.1 hypothetical protein BU25DRAFT_420732 [Macroventuria anomochaeta]
MAEGNQTVRVQRPNTISSWTGTQTAQHTGSKKAWAPRWYRYEAGPVRQTAHFRGNRDVLVQDAMNGFASVVQCLEQLSAIDCVEEQKQKRGLAMVTVLLMKRSVALAGALTFTQPSAVQKASSVHCSGAGWLRRIRVALHQTLIQPEPCIPPSSSSAPPLSKAFEVYTIKTTPISQGTCESTGIIGDKSRFPGTQGDCLASTPTSLELQHRLERSKVPRIRHQLSALRTIAYIKVVLLVTCASLARSNSTDKVALSFLVNTNGLTLKPAACRRSYKLRSTQQNVGNPVQNSLLGVHRTAA